MVSLATDPLLPPECAAVADDLAELALGTLEGSRRAVVLTHVESCSRCHQEVDELAAAADELLHLAPPAEPPVGFESRVFEQLRLGRSRRRQAAWIRRRLWAIAFAAAVLVAGFGAGVAVGGSSFVSSNNHPMRPPLEVAELTSDGTPVGKVMIYASNPTWLFLYVEGQSWKGELLCEVVLDHGPTVTLGGFWLSGGDGAWAAKINQPAGRIKEARLVGPKGIVAEAGLG